MYACREIPDLFDKGDQEDRLSRIGEPAFLK
jgi:hypothetical protein